MVKRGPYNICFYNRKSEQLFTFSKSSFSLFFILFTRTCQTFTGTDVQHELGLAEFGNECFLGRRMGFADPQRHVVRLAIFPLEAEDQSSEHNERGIVLVNRLSASLREKSPANCAIIQAWFFTSGHVNFKSVRRNCIYRCRYIATTNVSVVLTRTAIDVLAADIFSIELTILEIWHGCSCPFGFFPFLHLLLRLLHTRFFSFHNEIIICGSM